MEELKKNVKYFISSIENKNDIIVVQNNLLLLIAQINVFYYKYNYLNNRKCLSDAGFTINDLNEISKQIREVYPKFVELRKSQFKRIFIDELKCNSAPNDLIDNITRSNKIQKMITELTELMYYDQNEQTTSNSTSIIIIISIIFAILIVVGIIIFLLYKYHQKNKEITNSVEN